jgi:hypothetical protein
LDEHYTPVVKAALDDLFEQLNAPDLLFTARAQADDIRRIRDGLQAEIAALRIELAELRGELRGERRTKLWIPDNAT